MHRIEYRILNKKEVRLGGPERARPITSASVKLRPRSLPDFMVEILVPFPRRESINAPLSFAANAAMEAVSIHSSLSPSIIGHRRSSHHHQKYQRAALFAVNNRSRGHHCRLSSSSLCSTSSSPSSSCLFTFPLDLINTSSSDRKRWRASARSSGGAGDDGDEVERALGMDGGIPGTSDEFVRRVSSRAYDMRRHLNQTLKSSSYDVLESNPWRDDTKPVYVLTHNENQLCTMKTRQNRSEVEKELGLLFSEGGKRRLGIRNKAKQSRGSTNFNMFVEDIREGVLVFEDEDDATKYCDLLQGGGHGCEGIAELEASSVFDICCRMRALAVLFRRGRTPPSPKNLEQNLRARKRSLEDQM